MPVPRTPVVWRPVWGWCGYDDYHMQRILAVWEKQDMTVTEVARIKDTGWENSPNLYYHRPPVFGYIYTGAWPRSFPDTVILHVE